MTQGPRCLLITADRYPPFRLDVRVLYAQELARRGYRIDWLLQDSAPSRHRREEAYGGGTAYVGPMNAGTTRWQRLWKHVQAVRHEARVFRLLKTGRYDFVQVRDKSLAALLAWLAARRHGVPCCFFLSFPFPENSLYRARQGVARYPWLYRLRGYCQHWLLYRVLLPRMARVFVVSPRMKQDLVDRGVPAERITPVPMGIETEVAAALPTVTEPPAGKTVVYLGTMDRYRGLDILLQAFARVLSQEPEARLLMVGDSEAPESLTGLRREAEQLGIASAVTFTGQLPLAEARDCLAQARVTLSPFAPSPVLDSASPTKLVEYLAYGVPVVANEHPEHRAVLDESGAGFLVPWTADGFAEGMRRALSLSDAEWLSLSHRGQAWVRAHRTYDVIAERVDGVYQRLLSEGEVT